MMYGGKYMKSKNKDAKAAGDAETAKYQAHGCAGPSPTLGMILSTYKKK